MTRTSCPNCGAEMLFRAASSIFAVCAYCGSTVIRGDADMEKIGTMADLPDEMTPLQVGAELDWRRDHYVLAGRVRVGWADGAWNEWYLAGEAGTGWLAEAQGFLAIAFPQPFEAARGFGDDRLPSLDAMVSIGLRTYQVTDIKQAAVIGSEGELPFRAPRGRTATYIDMIDERGGFASIEASDGGRLLYTGEYVEFGKLRFTNLRPVEGWSTPVPA